MAEILQTDDQTDDRVQYDTWGELLEFEERAVLGIISHIPAADTPQDSLFRTIALYDWLRDQGHRGCVMVRGLDQDGDPLGSEDLPVLAIEITSESHEARDLGTIQRTRYIAAVSNHNGVDHDTLWLPTITSSPDLSDDLRDEFRPQIDQWTQNVWQANLAWIKSHRTHLMAVALVETPDASTLVECLEDYIEYEARQDINSWDECIQTLPGMPTDQLGKPGIGDLTFTRASPARLAHLAAMDLSDATQSPPHTQKSPARL